MYKVFILNRPKDSKGVSKYKINRLFIRYFAMKSLFIEIIYECEIEFFAISFKLNLNNK